MTKTFTITEERLLKLLKNEDTLLSLEGAGVDNWCGCDDAYEQQDEVIQSAESIDPKWQLEGVTRDNC